MVRSRLVFSFLPSVSFSTLSGGNKNLAVDSKEEKERPAWNSFPSTL